MKKKEGEDSVKFNNKPIIFSDEETSFNANLYAKILSHIKRSGKGLSKQQVINNLITYLDTNSLNPTIFFSFSRKFCEKLASFVTHSLLKGKEHSLVQKIIDRNLRKTDNYSKYVKMDQFVQLKKCLDKGVAFHHSGLLPIFKEIVEILFANKDEDGKPKPLIKVLFATETFAVGVNMPTKTVVFTGLEKFTDGEKRCLKPHEYLQMAGRAGRRGIDSSGLVILLPNMSRLPSQSQMKNLLLGKSQILQSKFSPNYKIILKALLNKTNINHMIDNSLVCKEISDDTKFRIAELEEIECPDIDMEPIEEYEKMKTGNYGLIRPSNKVIKRHRKKVQKLQSDPEFMEKYNFYLKNKHTINKKQQLLEQLRNNKMFISHQIQNVKRILMDEGYISLMKNEGEEGGEDGDGEDEYKVTVKGVVACEINECNEILLTEAITNNYFDNLDYKELGTILSIFGNSKRLGGTRGYKCLSRDYRFQNILEFMQSKIDTFGSKEYTYGLYMNTDWNIRIDCMNAAYEWLSGGDFNAISKKFGIYEGNLIKDFIKIYNLAACVKNIADILQKNELSIQASKLMENTMRDIVTIESLYIK